MNKPQGEARVVAEKLVSNMLESFKRLCLAGADNMEIRAGLFDEAKEMVLQSITEAAKPKGEKFICLGCGDLDAEIITESNPTGIGDGDEICKKCGGNDFCDSIEEALRELILSNQLLAEQNLNMQNKILDAEIAARVPPESSREYLATNYPVNSNIPFPGAVVKESLTTDPPSKPTEPLHQIDIPPKRIYLQNDGDEITFEGATWCQDRIDETDAEYIRADLSKGLLEAAKAVLEWYNHHAPIDGDAVMDIMCEAIEETQGKDRA